MRYYIAPRFLNKLAVHITKNFLDLPGVRVPLILGIHGRKGEGKTFQCDLVFEKMGIEVVRISAGELESPDAGDPSRLIRLRYREAAELVRVRGKMAVLLINDLDAGAGRFDQGTQYTVNTQLVNGTLMNIADHPTNVQLPGSYDENPVQRIPILVTGNDFSTLYAPLVRDGRMEKFYWAPNRSDRIGIVGGIFAPDGLSKHDVKELVDTFPNQAIDFYGALRARVYDEQVERFINDIGFERVSLRVVNSTEGKPNFPKPDFSLGHLKELGQFMVDEQKRIADMALAREYNQHLNVGSRVQPGSEYLSSNSVNTPSSQPGGSSTPDQNLFKVSPSSPLQVYPSNSANGSGSANGALNADVSETLQSLINQDCNVGIEYVDKRRFRTNSWQCWTVLQNVSWQDAIAQLESCLQQHGKDYVRLVGIDPKMKKRVAEHIVHRPI
ncbi:MAG: ribulose bisphosphate carboxylase small subunit [Cyanobacteria bacterium P01_F01_bin.150]